MDDHSDKRVVYVALAGNAAITVMKFVAASFSGSAAMLAEAFHSFADTSNQVMLLVGLARAKKPPDDAHPFGHGKELYFWAFVVAVSIFFVGATLSIYQGIHKLFYPEPLKSFLLPISVLGASILFESYSFRVAYLAALKMKRRDGFMGFVDMAVRTKDPTVMVVLLEDAAALAGLIVASIGITIAHLTGSGVVDALTSVLIGIILLVVALFLARETKELLIGESATTEDRDRIKRVIAEVAGVVRSGPPMTMHLGPDSILLNLDVEFANGLTTDEVEAVIDDIEVRVKEAVPAVKRIFIEAETIRKRRGKPKGPDK